MKALIVYYSYTGNTKKVAEALAEYLKQQYEVNIKRLKPQGETSSFFQQAIAALFHKTTQLNEIDYDLGEYDLICFGTPVWAFGPAPAMNTYLNSSFGLKDKRVVLFSTYGSGAGVNRCLNYMQDILSNKGIKEFKKFSIQQFQVKDKDFLIKSIGKFIAP